MERVRVLGVDVSVIDMDAAVEQLRSWRRTADVRTYVCVTPAHSLMECHADAALTALFNRAGMVTPDGMGVVWLLKLLGHPGVGRVYGPDLLQAACRAGVDEGWRHYFLGGSSDVLASVVHKLEREIPGVIVAGLCSPPFRPLEPDELSKVLAAVNQAKPDFVWIALGSPEQERWMGAVRGRLDAVALIGVGAAFDFLSGNKRQAPVWIQRAGMEWAFRLVCEPTRLWPRYRRYPRFVVLALADLVRARRRGRLV